MSIPKDHEMVRPEIRALIERGKITVDELKDLRCNSYEWEAMVPALSIDAIVLRAETALEKCSKLRMSVVEDYGESTCAVVRELIVRLRQAMALIARDTEELRFTRAAIQKAVDRTDDLVNLKDAVAVLTELSLAS
jgi:hypothetical protein